MFNQPRIPTMTAAEAHERLASGETPAPLLVDVREPDEIAEVRAEGIVALPLSTFMARYRELPTDRPLLMICRSGSRSGQATTFLLANGWMDVTNVAGGTLSWMQAALPVRRGVLEPGEADLPD